MIQALLELCVDARRRRDRRPPSQARRIRKFPYSPNFPRRSLPRCLTARRTTLRRVDSSVISPPSNMPIPCRDPSFAGSQSPAPLRRARPNASPYVCPKWQPGLWAVGGTIFAAAWLFASAVIAQTAARAEKPAPAAIVSSAVARGKIGGMLSHRVVSSDTRATDRARNLPPEFSINLATGVISGGAAIVPGRHHTGGGLDGGNSLPGDQVGTRPRNSDELITFTFPETRAFFQNR